MARINVNLSKIKYNAKVLQTILERKQIHFTPVVKCVAGDERIVSTIQSLVLHTLLNLDLIILND